MDVFFFPDFVLFILWNCFKVAVLDVQLISSSTCGCICRPWSHRRSHWPSLSSSSSYPSYSSGGRGAPPLIRTADPLELWGSSEVLGAGCVLWNHLDEPEELGTDARNVNVHSEPQRNGWSSSVQKPGHRGDWIVERIEHTPPLKTW